MEFQVQWDDLAANVQQLLCDQGAAGEAVTYALARLEPICQAMQRGVMKMEIADDDVFVTRVLIRRYNEDVERLVRALAIAYAELYQASWPIARVRTR